MTPKGKKDWGISSFWQDVRLQRTSKTLALRCYYGICTYQCELTWKYHLSGNSSFHCPRSHLPSSCPLTWNLWIFLREISYTELVSLLHILCVNTQGQILEVKALSSGTVHESFAKPGGEKPQRLTADTPALSSTPSGRQASYTVTQRRWCQVKFQQDTNNKR